MSDQMHTTVRVDTASDTKAVDNLLAKLKDISAEIRKLGTNSKKGITDDLNKLSGTADKVAKAMNLGQADGMRGLRQRVTFESRMNRQREREASDVAKAQRLFDVEALAALRGKFAFQSRMQRQAASEARDLAREQTEAVRAVARAQREAAKQQTDAIRDQIRLTKQLEQERSKAARQITGGAGKVKQGITRGAVAGAATGAVMSAAARRGLDKLTQSGVTIDESMAQAAIHIYGSQKPAEARKSAEALRKRLMPMATKLGSKTADLVSAYVEASQAGVDSDILDQVTGLGAKYAKMNKLNLPNTLEETGYALQGLKAFGKVTDQTVGRYFNHMSYIVATTAANREQMSSFGKRGLAAGASVGMSVDDSLAFGAAATAAGAEGSQAARMLSSQGGRIAGWQMKAADISRKHHKTEEDKLFLQAPRLTGFANFNQLATSFKSDFLGTFARAQEGLKKITDPLKRRSLEKMLFGQEFGSFTDAMVMGSNLREYRKKLNSPAADNFIDQNWAKQTGSFGFIVDQIKSVFQNLSDSLGLALKPIYEDLRDYVVQLPAAFDNFEDAFKAGLKGFMGGLGSPDGTMSRLLKQWLGNPADLQLNVKWIGDFSRGFGEGLRTVGETIRSFLSVFTGGDTSAAAIGRLTAKIIGFSMALVAVSPVVAVLGALGTAILGFAAIVKGAAALLRTAGLIGGGEAAAGAARGGAAAAGAAGAAGIAKKGILGRLGGILGVVGLADLAQSYGALQAPDGKKGLGRNIVDFLDPGLGSWLYGAEPAADAKAGETSTPWVDPPKHDATVAKKALAEQAKGGLVTALDALRASVDALREAIGKMGGNGRFDRTSTETRQTIESLKRSVQLAALDRTSDGVRRMSASATGSASSGSSADGIPYTAGSGGSSLYSSRPGGKLGSFGSGQRFGGGGSDGNLGSGVVDPRMSGDVNARAKAAHDFFRSKGLSEEATAGILASMKQESNFTPTSRGDGGKAHGLFQHHADRRAQILAATGINMSTASFDKQLEGAWWEMNHGDAGAQRALKALRRPGITAREAGAAFVKNFERPARDERASRGALAEGFARKFAGSGVPAKAAEALGGKPGTFSGAGKPTAPGLGAADLARSNPVAESLARTAPQPRSAGAGRSGNTTHAPITIVNNGDAEHTANQVQRRIQDAQNYVTHDVSFESA